MQNIYPILEFLLAPFGLLVLFTLLFILLMYVRYRYWLKRNSNILSYFKVNPSITKWKVPFVVSSFKFVFMQIGRAGGAVSYGPLKTIPTIYTIVSSPTNFIIANPNIKKYEFDWNLGSVVEQKSIKINNIDVLIGAGSVEFILLIENLLIQDKELAQRIAKYMEKDWAYLSLKKEILVGNGSLFKKQWVLRYFGFPPTVYEDPAELESLATDIASLLTQLKVTPEVLGN